MKSISKNSNNFFMKEILFNASLTSRLNALSELLGNGNPETGWLVSTLVDSGLILKKWENIKAEPG